MPNGTPHGESGFEQRPEGDEEEEAVGLAEVEAARPRLCGATGRPEVGPAEKAVSQEMGQGSSRSGPGQGGSRRRYEASGCSSG